MKTPLKYFLALALVSCATAAPAGIRVQYFVGYGLYSANSPDTATTAPGSGLLAVNGSHRALIQLISTGPNHTDDGLDSSNPGGGGTAGDDVLLDSRILELNVDGVDEWGYAASIPPPFVSTNSPSAPLFVRVHQSDTLSEDPRGIYDSPPVWPEDLDSVVTNPPADVMATVIHIETGDESPPMTGVALGDSEMPIAPALAIAPTSTNLSLDAAIGRSIEVTANVPWTATTNVSWLAITSGDSGTTNGTVVFGAAANAGTARTGAVIVAGGGRSRTCTVVQAGGNMTNWYAATNGNDSAAGTNWATAKLTIQAAVDVAAASDTVWASNGVYVGLVTVNKGVTVKSMNGPEVTTIQGANSRCVTLSNALAVVSGFTLTGGRADWGGGAYIVAGALEGCIIRDNTATGRIDVDPLYPNYHSTLTYGGGVLGGTLRDCRLIHNTASSSDNARHGYTIANGGGAYQALLINCLVSSNAAFSYNNDFPGGAEARGGGTWGGTNENCTLVKNSATAGTISVGGAAFGGGCSGSVNFNSIVWYNTVNDLALNDIDGGSCTFTCASNAPGGVGNFASEPAFINRFTGNWRLMSNSPCVDAGTNQPWMSGAADLDGNPRLAGGRVDLGAYEAHPGGEPANGWYVATNGNDAAAGTNWATAKLTIQAGIDASAPGDTIWVGNGVYATGGGRAIVGSRANRVAIDQAVTVRSVDGPETTFIVGAGMRCAYVVNGAVLSGFTLTNGSTASGMCGPSLPACGIDHNGGGAFCEDTGMLTNCVLAGNSAANEGGGSAGGILNNCRLTGNSSDFNGGGSAGGILNQCVLTSNSTAYVGGGAYGGTLNNCLLTGNSVSYGAGAGGCTLNNCTVTGNRGWGVGGVFGSTLKNCIVYGNTADGDCLANYLECAFTNSCTTPAPGGTGNITNDPQFINSGAGDYRLSPGSLCIDAGNNAYVVGTADLDGNPRISGVRVDMGAYEVQAPPAPALALAPASTNLSCAAVGGISIQVTANVPWTATTNAPWLAISSGASGTTNGAVVFGVAANDSTSSRTGALIVAGGGLARTCVVIQAAVADWFVATNGNDAADGRSWATAKQTIQAAVDVATNGGTVWVSNGVYAAGGGVVAQGGSNRVALIKPITVQSVNGPEATIIAGGGAMRCAYVTNGAVLSGFTVTNGVAGAGGGVWCETSGVANLCVIAGNSAGGGTGGGSHGGTLNECTLSGNQAFTGGGATGGTLNQCVLSGNSAIKGGGAQDAALNECVLTGNTAVESGGGTYGGALNDCTLTGNTSGEFGGGAHGATLNRCTLIGNTSPLGGGACFGTLNRCRLSGNSANLGGGAYESSLNNCLLSTNSANLGGGCRGGLLNNCTVAGNTASNYGGGAQLGTFNNCIVYANTAPDGANYTNSAFTNSCTTPDPGGTGNIADDPLFADAAAGDYRLQTNSPCLDAGDNAFVQGATDLDGNPRILNGVVDMGAYEIQLYTGYRAWAAAITNGLTNATDCAAGDGVPNLLKYAAGGSATEPDGLAWLNWVAGAPALRFNRNPDATDITLVIQGAEAISNGAAWRGLATNLNGSWGGASNVNESGTGSPVVCTVEDPAPLLTNRFLRLRVTRP